MSDDALVGKITHVFDKIGVGVVELTDALKIGETVKITGKDGDFEQQITSIQVNHAPVKEAKAGDDVGIKFNEPVKVGSMLYRV